MAEWSNAVASKAIILSDGNRGFESPSLLQFLLICNSVAKDKNRSFKAKWLKELLFYVIKRGS